MLKILAAEVCTASISIYVNYIIHHFTVFTSVTMPSTIHSTVSHGFKKRGGWKPIPTPAGVPMEMIVPALSVIPEESSLIT